MNRCALKGPKGSFLLGNLPAFGRDPLGFLEGCVREFGDFVPLRFLGRPVLFINDPAAIEQVLVTQARSFRKTIGYRTPFMRRLFGQGLLTSEGEFWTRQRRLSQPAFHRDRIATYAGTIVEFTEEMVASWRPGETRNIHVEMMRLTTRVVTRTLFNSPVPPEIDQMGQASVVVMRRFATQWNGFRLLLNLLPTAESRRFKEVMQRLDDYIFGLIRDRRANGKDHGDLLSMLLLARDDDGTGMNDQQLCDELKTLMVAGLDTTALTFSWALYLLARNPAVDGRLHEEIASVLQGRPPAFADLLKLRYTEAVVKETMRLYPPAWIVGREAIRDCEIAGNPIRPGISVIMSQWVKHRDARHFPDPEQFLPERWTGNLTLPKLVYFPFGAGPRICIGSSFAMMEAVLGLATIIQNFRFTAAPDYRVEVWPAITLQPKGGIMLQIVPRSEK
jgi:cytochrome P450